MEGEKDKFRPVHCSLGNSRTTALSRCLGCGKASWGRSLQINAEGSSRAGRLGVLGLSMGEATAPRPGGPA